MTQLAVPYRPCSDTDLGRLLVIVFLAHLTPSYGEEILTELQLTAAVRDHRLATCTSLDVEHEQGTEVFADHLQLAGPYLTAQGWLT